MITIIDYRMGNLRSVQKAFERIKIPAKITADPDEVCKAEKLVLPGVGHFERGMEILRQTGLYEALNHAVKVQQIPILGICLGMQLMTEFSEEGNTEGFGWIQATTKKFNFNINEYKVPHMGWNNLIIRDSSDILEEISVSHYYYFVHSFYVTCRTENEIIAETVYGHKFVSAFKKSNMFGCQFHPEKSHDAGLKILKNFAIK